MFEKSTSDARSDSPDGLAHRCVSGRYCRAGIVVEGMRVPAITESEAALCKACTTNITRAIGDLADTWVALYAAIGDQSRRNGAKVSGSREAPINLNTDVDAVKSEIVRWLVAAAAPVAESLNIEEPRARNMTDAEQAGTVVACIRILTPHIGTLLALEEVEVADWLPFADTDFPGESIRYQGTYIPNTAVTAMTGLQIARKLTNLRRQARALLDIPLERLSVPCPHCNEKELVRSHNQVKTLGGKVKQIDQIDCGNCKLNWPYERYQQLIAIWVREDEMEREKLQAELDALTARCGLAEYLLAEREWQFGLALSCSDIPASVFAQEVLDRKLTDEDNLLSGPDAAVLCGVAESTIRVWASQGKVGKHVAADGAMVYLASEVWSQAATIRRRPRTAQTS
jgi:transcription elongation factor Elf1